MDPFAELIEEGPEFADDEALLPDVEGLTPAVASGPRAATPGAALKEFWGFDDFRPLQREAIDAALAGRDCLLILPTGGGKSLCYQIPSLCQGGTTLVVSPLIALMDDQVGAACTSGLRAAALHSMLPPEQVRANREAALSGRLDLLYVSPERLCVDSLLAQIASHCCLVAIDEAHCISQWGHDFRPEYRQLQTVLAAHPNLPRMALTATATPQVQDDICAQLGLRQPLHLVGHPDRPNLTYRCHPKHSVASQIAAVIGRHRNEAGIVYAQTRKEVDRLTDALRRLGCDAQAYHAGLPDAQRRRVQEAFVAERLDVVVATIAFGMGIDRSNVRFVIHAAAPRSVEHYQQESGRAGRDGLPAECVLFVGGKDFHTHRLLAERDGPLSPQRKQALEHQLREIGRFAISPICRHLLLCRYFGAEPPASGQQGCGACDVCLGETTELPPVEALQTAQKIISAVWRTNSRFGAGHIVDILIGRETDKLRRNGHTQLSVFGLLREAGDRAVRSWIDQLTIQDFLQSYDARGFQLLGMTDAGIQLCKNQGSVRLSRFAQPATERRRSAEAPNWDAASWDSWEKVDRELFTSLRIWRKTLAGRSNLPPYVIFSDATLRELASVQPTDRTGLLAIKGIGARKADSFGPAVLAIIAGADPVAAAEQVEVPSK